MDSAQAYALVPFKGIYWKLSPIANHKVKANICPVPDITTPFLGVHFTKVISVDVYVRPTAIPAFGRENYGLLQGINWAESMGIGYQIAGMYLNNENNFRKLAHVEMSKYWKRNFLNATRKLVPSPVAKEMVPTKTTGIRPQLINTKTSRSGDGLHLDNYQ